MKKLASILLFSMLLVCIAGINQSWATTLNLGIVPSGEINGAFYEVWGDTNSGRGVFPTFLAIQGHGTSQGYNSDYRPVEFQEVTSLIHTHSIELGWVGQYQIASTWYYTFGLDADQAPGQDPLIYLTELQIFQTTEKEATGYYAGLGTKVYDLDVRAADNSITTDNDVWIDYSLGSGGSGQPDMLVSIPISYFDSSIKHVVLYSQFSNDNDGPQEWSYMAGPGAPPVPEPATMLLLGIGLLGLAGFRRKFRK